MSTIYGVRKRREFADIGVSDKLAVIWLLTAELVGYSRADRVIVNSLG